MGRTVPAIAGGVVLGIIVAFASAGAFQFPWGSGDQPQPPKAAAQAAQTTPAHQPAPANAPEPNEMSAKTVALPSWAPMVKKVMPTVVNIAITQEVKAAGMGGDEGEGGQEGPGPGPGPGPGGPGGSPFGPGSPFGGGGDPFERASSHRLRRLA